MTSLSKASISGVRFLITSFCFAVMLVMHPAQADETVTYYYTNQQGTVLATTDGSGQVISSSEYRPYGQRALGVAAAGPGYTGHVSDVDSGLVYMQARYYDPLIGRFLSLDPREADPGDIYAFGRYTYAGLNPIVYIDPDGRQTLPPSVYQIDWQDPQTREVAGEIYASMVPGYGIYQCASSGCSGGSWTFAIASSAVSAVGVVSRVSKVARAANEVSELSRLKNEVKSVHSALDGIGQGRRTTAGLLTKDSEKLFASGATPNLTPAQRAVVGELGGTSVMGKPGLHAEVKILTQLEKQGGLPKMLSTEGNRLICPQCKNFIEQRGGTVVDNHTATW